MTDNFTQKMLRVPGDTQAIAPLAQLDYRAFADYLPQVVWITDAQGRTVFYNKRWYEYTGIEPGHDVRVKAWDAIHPGDRDNVMARWQTVLRTGATEMRDEFRLRGKDGQYRWFFTHGFQQSDPHTGEVLHWIGSLVDIDAMRRAQETSRQSEERYRALVDASSQVVWTNTATGEMRGEQPGWSQLTGQTEAEYSGYGWAKAIHPDDAQPTIAAWEEAVRTRSPFLFTHRVLRRDGQWRLFSVRAVPILQAGDTVREWVGIHTDITGDNEMKAQRDALLQRVEEAADRQRRFLREMLSSMSEGRLRLCEWESELPETVTKNPFGDPVTLDNRSIRALRRLATEACAAAKLPPDRESDLMTAVGEAAMNAVVHAGGGTGTVYVDAAKGVVQIWVRDAGSGINEDSLHRATLEKGFTTAGTLGHGFWMMLKTVDRVYLLTGTRGTTVVMEQDRLPPVPSWMQSFVDGSK